MLKRKFFGVMAVLVVLMLTIGLAACSDGDSSGTGGGGGGGGGSNGNIPPSYSRGWPSDNTLAKYGLSGLPKWPNAGDSWYGTEKEDGVEVIAIVFEASSDPTSFYRTWFTSNSFVEYSYGGDIAFVNEKTGAVGTVYYEKSEGIAYVGGGFAY